MAEKKIGGREFRADPLLATQGVAMQVRLAGMLGNSMTRLPAIFAQYNADRSKAEAEAVSMLVEIVSRLKAEEVVQLCKDVLKNVKLKRQSGEWDDVDMDADFVDNPAEVYEVIVWALQVQVGPFFKGLLAAGSQGKPAKA